MYVIDSISVETQMVVGTYPKWRWVYCYTSKIWKNNLFNCT